MNQESRIKKVLKNHNSLYIIRNSIKVRGFTLIELIIVMVILGTLATVFVTQFPASLDRSRDTQRKSDLKQYQTALESYASRNNGLYPLRDTPGCTDITCVKASDNAGLPNLCQDLGLNVSGNTDCPADPKDNQTVCNSSARCRYFYRSNGGVSNGVAGATVYVLWGALQRPVSSSNRYFVVCSNGKSGEGPAPSSSACPI